MSTISQELLHFGGSLALEGEGLRLKPGPGGLIPPGLLALIKEHRQELLAELKEKRAAEEAALFEIALDVAKNFVAEAVRFLGLEVLAKASRPKLHWAYCERLGRLFKNLGVPPIGLPAFGELLQEAEESQERQAIQSMDPQTPTGGNNHDDR